MARRVLRVESIEKAEELSAERLHVRAADTCAKAIRQRAVHRHLRRTVGKVHEVQTVDMDLADVLTEIADDGIGEEIEAAAARLEQHLESVEKTASREHPVHRPFVAASVLTVRLDELIQRAAGLLDGTRTAVGIGFEKEHGAQAIRRAPGRPVAGGFAVGGPPPATVARG